MTSSDDQPLVWHYTNASGLLGMVEGKQLWATHYRFMNDKLEGAVLERAVWKLLENGDLNGLDLSLIREMYRTFDGVPKFLMSNVPDGNRFLICGAESGDELTLWRNYAREEVSFAVGLDRQSALGVIPPKKGSHVNVNVLPWRNVDYQPVSSTLPESHLSRISSALDQDDVSAQIRDVSSALIEIFCLAKSKAFKDEREVRVVCLADNTRLWRFRSGPFGITPYIALGSAKSWGESSGGKDPLPIREIRLSSNATDADILALNALLEVNGFAGEVEADEGWDASGAPIGGGYSEVEPPVRISQATDSLRF